MKQVENQKILMVNSTFNEGTDKKVDYRALINQYVLSKWYWYVAFFTVFLGLTYVYLMTIEPKYEIKSMVLIKEEDDAMAYDQDMLRRSMSFSSVSENAFNEMYVLNSFSSFYKIVEEMNLNIKYYWKHNLTKQQGYKDFPIVVDTFALNTSLGKGAAFDFEIQPVSEDSFKFIQDTLIGSYTFGQLFSNKYGAFRIKKRGFIHPDSDNTLHIQFLDSKSVAEAYLANLEIAFTDKNATVLELKLKDAIPERGIDVMVSLIEKYQEKKLKEKNEIALNTLKFIDDRLSDIGGELSDVESTIEQYKLRNDIASETTSDLDIVMSNVSRLNTEQDAKGVQLKVLESIKKTLETEKGEYDLIPINLSVTDNQLQTLINPYNELVLERRRIMTTGGPSNPLVQATDQKLISLKRSIYAAVDNLQGDLKMELGNLEKQYDRGVSRLRSVPRKERTLVDQSRQKAITEKLYIYLLEKKEETALTLIGTSPNFRVIDAPRSSVDIVSPNKKLFYFGSALAGLGIPFLFILGINLLKDTVQTEDELKEILPDHHIAGLIIFHKGKARQQALASEDFSSLRMDLQLRHKDRLSTILVTSSVASEGKTFVATQLAFNFAKAKTKTILIDFDLRNPNVARSLGKTFDKGLSDYFKEEEDIQDIIQPMEESSNLHIISGGTILSNPMGFITETKIKKLFAFLKSNYDIVIVDTSPIGIFSDAFLLNEHIDDSLYVIRSGFTKKTMVENAGEVFRQGKLIQPSLVLNAVKIEKIKNYKYYRY